MRALKALGIAALVWGMAGCAQPPAPEAHEPEPEPSATEIDFTACLVEDEAGATLDSELATIGEDLNIQIKTAQITDDYATPIQDLADASCSLIIGVGDDAVAPIQAAATQNPEVTFALIDAVPTQSARNLRPVAFNVHEASFLAGYLAAAQSSSKTVGVFGALDIPSVSIYMDGFVQGVDQFNTDHADSPVTVVGWDTETRNGVFVQSAGSAFDDPDAGGRAAQKLIDQGADVIMAVAGDSGQGALTLAENTDGVTVIWSGEDGCDEYSSQCSVIGASVVKDYAAAMSQLIEAQMRSGSTGVFAANLRNNSVDLVINSFNVDATLTERLDQLRQDIIDGKITVDSPSALS